MNRRKINVLLVEDEEAHAELIRRAFEPRAELMGLSWATNLREAREQLEKENPDLALIDLVLPDGKGDELLPADGEEAQYPIVIMTSHGDEEVAVEAMKAGALNYVVKSGETLANMPQIVEGALREWGHVVERRRAEEALQTSEEHFRFLIENALDVITEVDAQGTIHYASPAMERVLGYSPRDRIGTNMFGLIHPDDREEVIRKVFESFDQPGITQSFESRYRHKDGSTRVLEAVASTHIQADGQQRGVINSRDVTERKSAEDENNRLEEQLRYSQKWEIIGSLAGGIANEFNNMLTPILGFAYMALEEAPVGSKTRKGLEHILTAANRSRDLAEQILAFSRQSEPQRKPVQLNHLVGEALKLLRPSLPANIEIRHEIEIEQDTVIADPDQMHQVLMNLCTNAHHAMPEGGVLEVSLDAVEIDAEFERIHTRPHEGAYVRLTVRDTGHGMDSATKERVLEPFFTTKGTGERSGLGLSVAHGIVVSHGGDLMVESEPEKGTAIHVYLPQAERGFEQEAKAS
ncbi:MAG: PAS domain S-box protein [bacterium]|nr:PAS domain S-box protein [bacterium]